MNIKIILTMPTVLAVTAFADPIVIAGKNIPRLLGKPIASIVVLNGSGTAIPFQIDEVTKDGEYVLDKGESPNVKEGNGVLNEQDEIAFLWNDADAVDAEAGVNKGIGTNINNNDIDSNIKTTITLTRGKEKRTVTVVFDPTSSLPRSPRSYIGYNHNTGRVATEYYYADFAKDRFHFVRAGVMDFTSNKYVDLTNELRVEILLKTLFGLIPIRYGEGDLVCFVRRYKVGPIRLIRRGDFHLNLGFGVKGSRAAVNQICYPKVVKVPVYVHLPIRFRNLFSQAHIEMTPVIREAGKRFTFAVPSNKLYFPVGGDRLDTLCQSMPLRRMFTLKNGDAAGYGWILDATTQPEHISGSGFVMRRPGTRGTGPAECGFRLTVRDVPKGNYYITNWVLFSGGKAGDIERLGKGLMEPVAVSEEKYGEH
ncbi:MAG: hypothetical protein LBC59_04095 [Chitinispirillales bacterium]|nr:hypothetical protein [Chitinispirillales bacterium]